ncbi:hypothetical protein TKK_0009907 [Trichogramma kaykai]
MFTSPDHPDYSVVGLSNDGNQCWLNSTVQVLFSLPIYNSSCIKGVTCSSIILKLFLKLRACLQALKSNDQEISTLKNCFQQSLKAIDNAGNVSSYASREQQDCTEFFQSLLCHFKEVYGASDRQNRFLDELFTVTLKKSLLCSKCYHCTNNGISLEEDHNVMFLSMDNDHTQENINLTDLLFKIKNNEREQECSKCLKSTTHIINTCISKYPKFVLLALNRFSVNNNKICQPVYVPDCLDLNFLKETPPSCKGANRVLCYLALCRKILTVVMYPGEKNNTFVFFYDGYNYHKDSRYPNILRCSKKGKPICCRGKIVTIDKDLNVDHTKTVPHHGHEQEPQFHAKASIQKRNI